MRRLAAVLAVLALVLVGCGGGGDEGDPLAGGDPMGDQHADHAGNPTAHCEPSGTTLSITAEGTAFDTDCLAAPADRPFTIRYDNKDQLPHSLAILESHSATDAMFKVDVFRGPEVKTVNAGPLRPGTYAFHCEVHPAQMSGTFIVK